MLALSCSPQQPLGAHGTAKPSGAPAASASSTSPTGASPTAVPRGEAYGLLLSAGGLVVIPPDATLAATASLAAPPVQVCAAGPDPAGLQPPGGAGDNPR